MLMEPLKGAQQRPISPLEGIIALPMQDHRRDHSALKRFPNVLFLGRRPPERATATLVVRQHAVHRVLVLHAPLRVDADRVASVALPRLIAITKSGIRAAIAKPAPEHASDAIELAAVAQVGSDCRA
jgi:hypothetical protein